MSRSLTITIDPKSACPLSAEETTAMIAALDRGDIFEAERINALARERRENQRNSMTIQEFMSLETHNQAAFVIAATEEEIARLAEAAMDREDIEAYGALMDARFSARRLTDRTKRLQVPS